MIKPTEEIEEPKEEEKIESIEDQVSILEPLDDQIEDLNMSIMSIQGIPLPSFIKTFDQNLEKADSWKTFESKIRSFE